MNHQHEPNKTARELKTRLVDLSPEEQAIIRWLAMGCGKTSAVRSLLDELTNPGIENQIPVKKFSFVSLAGVASISDARVLFLQGFDDWNQIPPLPAVGPITNKAL